MNVVFPVFDRKSVFVVVCLFGFVLFFCISKFLKPSIYKMHNLVSMVIKWLVKQKNKTHSLFKYFITYCLTINKVKVFTGFLFKHFFDW